MVFLLAIPFAIPIISAAAPIVSAAVPFVIPFVSAAGGAAIQITSAAAPIVSAAVPFVIPSVSAAGGAAFSAVTAAGAAISVVVAILPIRSARAQQRKAEETAREMQSLAHIAIVEALSMPSGTYPAMQRRLKELERMTAYALRTAQEALLAVERRWFEGVRPECHPSHQDISRMKARYHYSPEFFHIAVVGSAGAGKSSFINAVCGLSRTDSDPIAAPTGIVETTDTVTRYPDPSPNSRMIWYDVPGAGTPMVSDWKYFNDMGLYIFDCVIVLTDNRVLESDLAILRTCEQFKSIKAFIVRAKSDQHINNMVCERMPRGFDIQDPDMDDETRSLFLRTKLEERNRFIVETRQNVGMHLEREKLPPKKVYIVCMDAMLAIVSNLPSPKAIDEAELLNDVKGFLVS